MLLLYEVILNTVTGPTFDDVVVRLSIFRTLSKEFRMSLKCSNIKSEPIMLRLTLTLPSLGMEVSHIQVSIRGLTPIKGIHRVLQPNSKFPHA
jgi:hypothetical protein